MARPKADPSIARTEHVSVRLSPLELAQLKDKAARSQRPMTDFVRAAALGKRVTVTESTAPDFATRHELRRIGVNLNQIAHALNAGRGHIPAELNALCEKLDRLFDRWLDHDSTHRQSRPKL